MTQTPAGWYPDPYGTPQLRWWDGTQWTDATHPLENSLGQSGPVTTGQWAPPGPSAPGGTAPQSGGAVQSGPAPQSDQAPQPGPVSQSGPVSQPGAANQFGPAAQQGDTGPNPVPGAASPHGTGPGAPPQGQPGTGPYPAPPASAPQFLPQGSQQGPPPGPQGPPPAGQQGPQPTAVYQQPGAPQGTAQFAPPGGTQYPSPGPYAPPGGPQGAPTGPYGAPAQQQWGQPGNQGNAGNYGHPGNPGNTAQFSMPEFGGTPPPPKKSPMPWVLGGGALVILLVVALVIGFTIVRGNDGTPTAIDSPAPVPSETIEPNDPQITPPLETPPTPGPSPSSSIDFPAVLPQPKGGRVTDPRTGVSFTFPGAPWTVSDWAEINGNGPEDPRFPQWTAAYQAISQKDYDGQGHDWVSQVASARLPKAFEYTGVGGLRGAVKTVLLQYEPIFYSPPHKSKIIKDEAIEVSGKKAWLLRFELDFTAEAKKNGWKFQKEEGFYLVIDQGPQDRPTLVYASVPDNLDTKVIDRVLDSLKAS
ncbi:DUF2510 domain-containing protein [Sphaerisporangium sp. NPDC051011]|uniref:DUF2510 domain-containing protein n=1 Tax=Sphaerisporangium sp. NPDC051011 TaxID=3155792 RepID=UPI0033C49016